MRKNPLSVALEAIAFQSGDLFKDLTGAVASLRGFGGHLDEAEYWQTEEVGQIAAIIKNRTNINVKLGPASVFGPTVQPPRIDNNHPFTPDWVQKELSNGYRRDQAVDARRLMKTMGLNLVRGEVDLQHSRVSGVFAEMMFEMWLPRDWLEEGMGLSAESVAAIIIHEVGHIFTYFEYAGRTFSTNLVLAGLTRALKKDVGDDVRQVVFARGAELLYMSEEQKQALMNAKNEINVTGVVLDAMITRCRSELKCNIFDATGSEFVADQFAARHGAARALVIANEQAYKIARDKKLATPPREGFQPMAASLIGLLAFTFVVTIGAVFVVYKFLMTYLLSPDYEVPDHNTIRGRYQRLLNECVARMKNPNLTQYERESVLADYDAIKAIMRGVDDDLPWLNKLSYYLNPRYRNARKFHLMQTDLENIAHSGLYASAARLRSL